MQHSRRNIGDLECETEQISANVPIFSHKPQILFSSLSQIHKVTIALNWIFCQILNMYFAQYKSQSHFHFTFHTLFFRSQP